MEQHITAQLSQVITNTPVEPLFESITILGPTYHHIAKRLHKNEALVVQWARGEKPLPPKWRKQMEALAVEAFAIALNETRARGLADRRIVRDPGYKRWLDRVAHAARLLRGAGLGAELDKL